jgi:hypothetical protein
MMMATLHCLRDEQAPSVLLDIREERFKLMADARQVGVVAGDKYNMENYVRLLHCCKLRMLQMTWISCCMVR